jgi:hypothetical protein
VKSDLATLPEGVAEQVREAVRQRIDREFMSVFSRPGSLTATVANSGDPGGTVLTIDKLRAAMRKLAEVQPPPEDMLTKIVVTSGAVRNGERLFPASRHRSARVRKKLVKRFGGEFEKIPQSYKVGSILITHPALAGPVIAAAQPRKAEFGASLFSIPVQYL